MSKNKKAQQQDRINEILEEWRGAYRGANKKEPPAVSYSEGYVRVASNEGLPLKYRLKVFQEGIQRLQERAKKG
jgi:hypothetical protein